jgi:hypothetical protein
MFQRQADLLEQLREFMAPPAVDILKQLLCTPHNLTHKGHVRFEGETKLGGDGTPSDDRAITLPENFDMMAHGLVLGAVKWAVAEYDPELRLNDRTTEYEWWVQVKRSPVYTGEFAGGELLDVVIRPPGGATPTTVAGDMVLYAYDDQGVAVCLNCCSCGAVPSFSASPSPSESASYSGSASPSTTPSHSASESASESASYSGSASASPSPGPAECPILQVTLDGFDSSIFKTPTETTCRDLNGIYCLPLTDEADTYWEWTGEIPNPLAHWDWPPMAPTLTLTVEWQHGGDPQTGSGPLYIELENPWPYAGPLTWVPVENTTLSDLIDGINGIPIFNPGSNSGACITTGVTADVVCGCDVSASASESASASVSESASESPSYSGSASVSPSPCPGFTGTEEWVKDLERDGDYLDFTKVTATFEDGILCDTTEAVLLRVCIRICIWECFLLGLGVRITVWECVGISIPLRVNLGINFRISIAEYPRIIVAILDTVNK